MTARSIVLPSYGECWLAGDLPVMKAVLMASASRTVGRQRNAPGVGEHGLHNGPGKQMGRLWHVVARAVPYLRRISGRDEGAPDESGTPSRFPQVVVM